VTLDFFIVAKPTREQLNQYAGDYYSEELAVVYSFEVGADGLTVKTAGRGESAKLEPTITDVFTSQGVEFVFKRGQDSGITGFNLNAGRVTGIRFIRKPATS
jgi:hypothetical protein